MPMYMRSEWQFTYPACDIGVAAAQKRDYHRGRVEFWSKKRDALLEKIKESGITVTDSFIETVYACATPTLRGAQVMIDPEMHKQLGECQEKVKHHEDLAHTYEKFSLALCDKTIDIPLTVDDINFFFYH